MRECIISSQLLALCFVLPVLAQPVPREQWAHAYGDSIGFFRDLFITENGNFAMTGFQKESHGQPQDGWLVVVDSDGQEIINRTYGSEGEDEDFWTLIEVEGGGYLMGGNFRVGDGLFTVLRVDEEGEEIWWNNYGGNRNSRCHTIIELKDGAFAVAGWSRLMGDSLAGVLGQNGYVAKVSGDGDLIWEFAYGGPSSDAYYSMRETEEGIILAGQTGGDAWVMTIDKENGEPIWERNFNTDEQFENHTNTLLSIISCREGGFFAVGYDRMVGQASSRYWVIRLEQNGEREWDSTYELGENGSRRILSCVQQMPDNGFATVGAANGGGAIMMRLDREGNRMWERNYHWWNDDGRQSLVASFLHTVLLTEREELISAGWGGVVNEPGNGILLKLVPERTAPMIIHQYPESVDIMVLPGTQISFDVDVIDLQNDPIDYEWRLDARVISTDTTVIIDFENVGDYRLWCWVTDGELADSADWSITSSDLFIASHTPDTLNLTLRRGSSVDFSIDSVAAVEDEQPVSFQWTLIPANEQAEVISEDSTVTIDFLRSGNYVVEGMAYRGDSHDEVVWDVEVRGAIWSFLPEGLRIESLEGENVEFQIIPTISDSLNWYIWLYDGGMIREGRDSVFVMNLFELGEHFITGILADSIESDTVEWVVNVLSDFVGQGGQDARPTEFGIASVSPNPFNSTLTIRFSVGAQGLAPLRLAVYDLSGREVARFLDSKSEIRNQKSEIVWNASGVPAGVYLLRLESGGQAQTQKIVLLR